MLRFCAALVLVSAFGIACGSGAEPPPSLAVDPASFGGRAEALAEARRELEIRLDVPDEDSQPAAVGVLGIPSQYLTAFRGLSPQQWASALRVTVAADHAADDPAMPAVAGSFSVVDRSIVFTPQFGFDPGRRYRVVFDASHLPATRDTWRPDPVVAVVGLPGKDLAPSTVVARVYPTAALVPENQLRLYIHFSAPMGLKGGIGHVRLLDEAGREVEDPFLPLDADFSNRDRTRFTVFFDPGRQKRGILPNEEMGRSLIAGRSYTLVISREWRDAQGLPLKEEFRRVFKAGPPDERPLDQKTWRVDAPRAGTRDPLSVMFPEPLDHGLLLRALGVADAMGSPVEGERRIEDGETRWTFTPTDRWRSGEYFLMALTILEDMAGNRIGRAFEVDRFDRADESAEPETVSVPFQITFSASP